VRLTRESEVPPRTWLSNGIVWMVGQAAR